MYSFNSDHNYFHLIIHRILDTYDKNAVVEINKRFDQNTCCKACNKKAVKAEI